MDESDPNRPPRCPFLNCGSDPDKTNWNTIKWSDYLILKTIFVAQGEAGFKAWQTHKNNEEKKREEKFKKELLEVFG